MPDQTQSHLMPDQPDSAYSWWRLVVSLAMSTIGGVGMWSVVVILPTIEVEFNISRADASLPYMATMIGFAPGGIFMGLLADKRGVFFPLFFSALIMGFGYILASYTTSLWQFIAIQAVCIGMFGSSASFAPLVADITHWFVKRRGIAIAIVASGNYVSATIWPPLLPYCLEQ